MALFSTIGSIISSSKSNSASNKAADASVAVAQENNALARDIYGQNKATLSPFVQSGTAAGALLNDFYGIPQTTQTIAPATTSSGGVDWEAYVRGNPDAMKDYIKYHSNMDLSDYGQYHYTADGSRRDLSSYTSQPATQAATSATSQAPGVASQNAFSQYLKNSDYAFQQATGNNQVNSGYAGAGTVQSGAAMKALEKYRQDLQSGYRNQWASGVANQQGVGLGAASALAGVGQNYVSNVSANNTAAGDARANAALRQQSVFGNALGTYGAIAQKAFLSGGFG